MSPLLEVIKIDMKLCWKRNLLELDFYLDFNDLAAEMAEKDSWRSYAAQLRNDCFLYAA